MRLGIDHTLCTGDGPRTDHCSDIFTLLENGYSDVHSPSSTTPKRRTPLRRPRRAALRDGSHGRRTRLPPPERTFIESDDEPGHGSDDISGTDDVVNAAGNPR